MSRQWLRASVPLLCGACGHIVETNAPIQVVTITGMKRQLVRGECCVGAAPPDLPSEPGPIQQRTKKLEPIALTAKKAAAQWKPYKD